MSEKEQPPIMDQKLCVNGCGFFGSSQTSHMCSKCWKDAMTKTMRDADANTDGAGGNSTPIAPETKPPAGEAMDAANSSSSPSQQPQSEDDSPQQVPPPPSPASPDASAMMAVDPAPSLPSPTDVMVPPQPPTTATAMEEVVDEDITALIPAAPEPAEAPVAAQVAPMAVGEEEQAAAALPDGARGAGAGMNGAVAAAAAAPAASTPAIVGGAAVAMAGAAASVETPVARPVQKNRKRCFKCNKKVGYTGIACRCEYVFCSLHRYPEQHGCTFDFKTSDRKELEKTVVGGGQFSKFDRL